MAVSTVKFLDKEIKKKNNLVVKKIDQKELFHKCLEYLSYLNKKNIDISSSGYTYFCTWSKTIGYHKAKSLIGYNKINLIFEGLKNIIKIGYFSNFELEFNNKLNTKNIFIAWSTNNTLNKGLFKSERYISGFNNYRKDSSWFLIHQDVYNKNIKLKNVFVLKRKKVFFNFFFLVKVLFKNLKRNKINFLKIFHELNTESIFSEIVLNKFFYLLKNNETKKIIISYEAQPFQKYLINQIKEKYPSIKIYCDIHSLQPSYIHLIDLEYKSNFYITHNSDQKNFLIKKLKISPEKIIKKKIKISKSKNNFLGKIFLPYSFDNTKIIINSLSYLQKKKYIEFNQFSLNPHPVALNDSIYKKNCAKIKKNFQFGNNKSKKVLIVGNTNVLFEVLELKLDVIHIIIDEICDKISPFFWKRIKITKLKENIYKYSYLKK